jgi:hypothetical protein
MPTSRRSAPLFALLALLALGRPAAASTPTDASGCSTVRLVHGFWAMVSDVSSLGRPAQQEPVPRPRPQAIAPAQSDDQTVDIGDLSKPTTLETRLRSALRPREGAVHLTVPNGTARQGDFSVGSNESVPGNLLVVDGTADVYGRLMGNLVTVDGDVVLHPGGLVSGDILTLGGQVRDQVARSAAKCGHCARPPPLAPSRRHRRRVRSRPCFTGPRG